MTGAHEKSVGEIGSTFLRATAIGQEASVQSANLPKNKEELEAFFATRFVDDCNRRHILGKAVSIASLSQSKSTDNLDFSIKCQIADYLELAELNPRSENFGRATYRTGKLDTYQYAKWIYFRIVAHKQRRYGITSQRTILLLYITHWQFIPPLSVIECLSSFCSFRGCDFTAVCALLTDGDSLIVPTIVHPTPGTRKSPKRFKGQRCRNHEPGRWRWNVSLDAEGF